MGQSEQGHGPATNLRWGGSDAKVLRMKKTDISLFFERLSAADPTPQTELAFTNNFTFLVSVVLSAQAAEKGVNRATEALFRKAESPEKMAALGEAHIRDYIKTIWLYRNKAKNVYALSVMLCDQFDSAVPQDRATLMSLPGVGRKTANVVKKEAFDEATFALDTHVFRLSNRFGLKPGKTVLDVEKSWRSRCLSPIVCTRITG